MSLYTSSGAQWPVLQSKREQKFKNGLMAVSADFIAPKNQNITLTQIESSEGPCEVYPLPLINFDTSPFKTISATGYKVWDSQGDENIFQQPVDLIFYIYFSEYARDETGRKLFPWRQTLRYESKKIQIIAESGIVNQTYDSVVTIPTLSRALAITQQKKTWAASEIFNFRYIYDQPTTTLRSPTPAEFLSSLSSQNFTPNITTLSATYSVIYEIDFGFFFESEP